MRSVAIHASSISNFRYIYRPWIFSTLPHPKSKNYSNSLIQVILPLFKNVNKKNINKKISGKNATGIAL